MRVSLLRTGKGGVRIFILAVGGTRVDRRSSGKSWSWLSLSHSDLVLTKSPTILTIYILNNVPETASNLPKALMLSADWVRKGFAEGILWLDPQRDRHF